MDKPAVVDAALGSSVVLARDALPAPVQALLSAARDLALKSSAENTLRAYRRAWESFDHWARGHGVAVSELRSPENYARAVELVLAFLTSRVKSLQPGSLRQTAAGIAHAFFTLGVDPNPAKASPVKLLLRGVEHSYGKPPQQKAALRTDAIAKLVTEGIDRSTLQGKRDAAVILVGFTGAFRRSELVAVDMPHLRFVEEGMIVVVPRSKGDQTGMGKPKGFEFGQYQQTCPVQALKAWLEAAKIDSGPVFRGLTKSGTVRGTALSAGSVAQIVKRAAQSAGLDPKAVAGHSLRAGYVTEMKKRGARDEDIMLQTFHGSIETLRKYYREAHLFEHSPTRLLGL